MESAVLTALFKGADAEHAIPCFVGCCMAAATVPDVDGGTMSDDAVEHLCDTLEVSDEVDATGDVFHISEAILLGAYWLSISLWYRC